ncbi:MAG: hypothetical protein A2271_01515 [Candidatus Moranbacteria bacterium RIFOXYA12_FULL_35_19]|nr:MAG: hypothetical protein UR78_C0012G0026 [Candidatus Moranbacteria bacterium GW2011_GWF2_35_39]OGI32916.1 MAG: hypothetical protein A2489_00665 [Candidatus Moranbacteria bacterium RIFOXYC12_FULL_36_13]OGI35964.1 MAG: hypothetical protein A2271_01515 [Candidatus Moranbacteria bacterium RIFOXYA12_FULL_35_19]
MDEEIKKKLESGLLYGFFELENKDKINKINVIKIDYQKQIEVLKQERDKVISESVAFLEERKMEEIRKGL